MASVELHTVQKSRSHATEEGVHYVKNKGDVDDVSGDGGATVFTNPMNTACAGHTPHTAIASGSSGHSASRFMLRATFACSVLAMCVSLAALAVVTLNMRTCTCAGGGATAVAGAPGSRGPPGPAGANGSIGAPGAAGKAALPLVYEWNGTSLRVGNGSSWGAWVQLGGAPGVHGAPGRNGTVVFAANSSCGDTSIGVNVACFGAAGDSVADDTGAIQAAIDAAAPGGMQVHMPVGQYKTTASLRVPAGVTLVGHSMGKDPLQALGWTGTVIQSMHTGWAVEVSGSLAGLSDLVVADPLHAGAGGVLCNGTGRGLESLRFNGVLLFGFTSGTALKLEATNGGAVTYSTFYDVRVRNARIGIHLVADGVAHAFVNSNTFIHGAVSGGGFDYGLLMEGPGANNNNIFVGTIIEPPTTSLGHLVVRGSKSQIVAYSIRIEGSSQSASVPMIQLAPDTDGSVLTGLFSGGPVQVSRLNHMFSMNSGKAIGLDTSSSNGFANAALLGGLLPLTSVANQPFVPYWSLDVSGVNVSRLDTVDTLVSGHSVLNFTVPVGTVAKLLPDTATLERFKNNVMANVASFGAYVRTSQPGTVFWSMSVPAGVTSSAFHLGDGRWGFLGMSGKLVVDDSARVEPRPKLWMDNSGGSMPLEVSITVPTFRFGSQNPVAEASLISSAGGIMTGTLTTAVVDAYPPATGTFWTFPPGNTFLVHSTSAMHRINDVGSVRFPRGSVITLVFQEAGLPVLDSVYINTMGSYTSTSGSSLVLLSLDGGTWQEVSRSGV